MAELKSKTFIFNAIFTPINIMWKWHLYLDSSLLSLHLVKGDRDQLAWSRAQELDFNITLLLSMNPMEVKAFFLFTIVE